MDKYEDGINGWPWIVVGMGGTTYGMSGFLAILMNRYEPRSITLVDPDFYEEKNQGRQWPGDCDGIAKVDLWCPEEMVANSEYDPRVIRQRDRIQGNSHLTDRLPSKKGESPVVILCNPDNDQARIDTWEMLAGYGPGGIMVVTGCDRIHGQAYPGVMLPDREFNWRPFHPDVGQEEENPQPRCNAQTAFSNQMTGILAGRVIEDLDEGLRIGDLGITEYFWEQTSDAGLKVWSRHLEMEKVQ